MSFRKILIAVDNSPIAARAAEVGAELAGNLHAQIALVHTIEPEQLFGPGVEIPRDELETALEKDSAQLMADLRASLPPGVPAQQFVEEGSPGEVIVKTAAEWGADAIVIGSHGRRGVTRAILGSVAEFVMRHAPCPVLVVRVKT